MKDLTVVIPAYNEEAGIKTAIKEVNNCLPESRILVIDDASSDRTLDIVKGLKQKYKNLDFVSHDKNKGYGAALVSGFQNAYTGYVAFLDADMTYHPKYIASLMEAVKKHNLDVAWCNRFGGRKNNMPLIRKIGNRMLAYLFMAVTLRYIPDISSGERVFKREAFFKLAPETLPSGLDTITAMTKRIVKRKLKFRLIPIEYLERVGASKLNIFKDFLNMSKNIVFEK